MLKAKKEELYISKKQKVIKRLLINKVNTQ